MTMLCIDQGECQFYEMSKDHQRIPYDCSVTLVESWRLLGMNVDVWPQNKVVTGFPV